MENRVKGLDGFSHEILLREVYETIFGISDLTDKKEPLGLVRYTNADTLGDTGPIAELIQEYRNHELKDKYGISLQEYFNTPVNIARILVSNALVEKEDLKAIVASAERSAKKP